MNDRKRRLFLALALLASWFGANRVIAEEAWTLESPDGRLTITVALIEPGKATGYPADRARLYYSVSHQSAGEKAEVVRLSPLGICRDDQAFIDSLQFVSRSEVAQIDESYRMPSGKRTRRQVLANQQTLTFRNRNQARLQIVLRASNDGVAFRYRFPETDSATRTVVKEITGCRPAAKSIAWMSPYQQPGRCTPAYEEYYVDGVPVGTPAPTPVGWALPVLLKTPDSRWILLTEAAVDGSACGTHLHPEAEGGVYRFRFPEPGEGAGMGEVYPSSTLPWTLPWRVLLVSDKLSTLVESTLIDDLNPRSRIADTSWIKAGRVAWSWWSDPDSPRDYAKQCKFIDLAAEMGWEYYLVDANWTLMDGGTVRQLIDYAKQKGVGVLLWYNSGGEHNRVTEKPRGTMKDREVRRFEFEMLQRWGVKGIKVDFFHSDKQDAIRQYLGILQDAADFRLLVNFHGCTLPRGWSRTWPNLLSMESVNGEECYLFDPAYPEKAPRLNTIIPFTRNIVGPTDLTPCAFSDSKYPHRTTFAHELALTVVIESGLVHLADSVDVYRQLPRGPKRFLSQVPAAWDETRLLSGKPGEYVVIARRKGQTWFVGAIHAGDAARQLEVSCRFLGSGRFQANLIGDGQDARRFREAKSIVSQQDTISVSMLPYGGATIELSPLGND